MGAGGPYFCVSKRGGAYGAKGSEGKSLCNGAKFPGEQITSWESWMMVCIYVYGK